MPPPLLSADTLESLVTRVFTKIESEYDRWLYFVLNKKKETKLKYKPTKSFPNFLKQLTTKHNLKIIANKVSSGEKNRRVTSQSLLGAIRLFDPTVTPDDCRSDTTCLRELLEAFKPNIDEQTNPEPWLTNLTP